MRSSSTVPFFACYINMKVDSLALIMSVQYLRCNSLKIVRVKLQNYCTYLKFSALKSYIFVMMWQIISTILNVITSGGQQPFHEPWWTVEGTTGIQSAATLPIPEGIMWVEYMLASTFAGSITEVVIPHKWWDWERDWVVYVGAGTKVLGIDGDYLMKSSCKVQMCFLGLRPW